MRLALHTVICCCVFTTVLPLVKGATEELNTSLKKRFRVCPQRRMKRDQHSSLETANEQLSDILVGPQQDGDANIVLIPSSIWVKIRPRRSASSKSSGCFLVTCSYHDLISQLYQFNNTQRQVKAPDEKIGSRGYGRRRRRSLKDVTQLGLLKGGRRWNTEAGQRVRRHKSTRTVA